MGHMLIAIVATTQHLALSKPELELIDALQRRDVQMIRNSMNHRVSVFTIVGGPEAMMKSELDETYLVACDTLQVKEDSKSFQIGLERLSKIITLSIQKGKAESKYLPQRVKSTHNDLTPNTIRGLVKEDDFWELHYDIKKNGQLVLQRICEFDHASKFVW